MMGRISMSGVRLWCHEGWNAMRERAYIEGWNASRERVWNERERMGCHDGDDIHKEEGVQSNTSCFT